VAQVGWRDGWRRRRRQRRASDLRWRGRAGGTKRPGQATNGLILASGERYGGVRGRARAQDESEHRRLVVVRIAAERNAAVGRRRTKDEQ